MNEFIDETLTALANILTYTDIEEIRFRIRRLISTLNNKRINNDNPLEYDPEIEMCECGYHPKDDTMKCDL